MVANCFIDCKENSDFQKLISVLRDALPEKDFPHKAEYSDREILSLYEPDTGSDTKGYKGAVEEYGDAQCVCGHPIKYVYAVHLRSNPGVVVEPVGSKCIESFDKVLFDGACLRRILASISLQALWNGEYTTGDFSAENGFTKGTLDFLRGRLDDGQHRFLTKIVRKRKDSAFTPAQIRFMYAVMKRVREIYNNIIEESNPVD